MAGGMIVAPGAGPAHSVVLVKRRRTVAEDQVPVNETIFLMSPNAGIKPKTIA